MQIGLATSEEIQSWAERSFLINGTEIKIGEVKKADTINYRSFKPEKDGLFCERIFGPVKDWVCSCGQSRLKNGKMGGTAPLVGRSASQKSTSGALRTETLSPFSTKTFSEADLRSAKLPDLWSLEAALPPLKDSFENSQGVETIGGDLRSPSPFPSICPNCQVEVTLSRVRRYRMGYIELGCGVTHIWYLNSRPNIFSILLKIPTKYVKKITYYRGYSPALVQDSQDLMLDTPQQRVRRTSRPTPEGGRDRRDLRWTFARKPSTLKKWLSSPGVFGSENPSVAPGGDFFDNEWEFLHLWFHLPRQAKASIAHQKSGSFADQRSASIAPRFEKKTSLPHPLEGDIDQSIKLVSSIPSWLENTGARAFQQHFQTRNWQKEFEKLNEDLRRTPVFFNTAKEEAKVPGPPLRSEHQGDEFLGGENDQRSRSPQELRSFVLYENLLKRRKKRVRTLKLLNTLRTAGGGTPFDGFIFNVLPVLPPELRPIVQLSAGQFASSDVNDLYRRLISRNNRLKYYFTACGPHLVEFLVRSEQHLVQVAVDALFDGSSAASEIGSLRRGLGGANPRTGGGRSPTATNTAVYKSLSDRIGGKQGRFRQNLLGKRVDYSGRSVIVVGPRLKLHECGLPYEMALELFQAFIIRHILELQLAKTIRGAKNLIKLNKPFARQILQNIIEAHPILLNRAPTLHRLGIQAFQPKLISGRAIQLHPLVCSAFNADFDGDQMAVHVPLSPKSRVEARLLMLATTNWLSAATGQPSILPSQDMVLGFYYLTSLQKNLKTGGIERPEVLRPSKSNILSSLYSMTEIVQNGPGQRNTLNLHKPLWLYTNKLWANGRGKTTQGLRTTFGGSLPQIEDFSPKTFGRPPKEFSNPPLSLQKPPSALLKSYSGNEGGKGHFYEPLVLRVFSSGFANQVYHSYKWTQNTKEERSNRALRTTAGRVLVNQILEKLAKT